MEIVNLNLIPDGFTPIIHVSQNDVGRVTRFKLYNGFVPFILTGSESIMLRIRKPDASYAVIPIVNTSDSYVDIPTTSDMTELEGQVYGKLRIDNIGAKSIKFLVQPRP